MTQVTASSYHLRIEEESPERTKLVILVKGDGRKI